MQRLTCIHILCGLTLLFLSGCYHNSPYGYNNYPGVFTAPPAGGGYVPQGATILPPTQSAPGSTGTFQQDQWSPTQVSPSPADDVPIYDGQNNNVPNYSDPGTDFSDPGTFDSQPGNETPPMGDFSYNAPRQPYSAAPARIQLASGASNQFLPPISASSTPENHIAERIQASTRNEPSPYDYDKRHFRWLRGIADYNPEDNSWHLIYNLQPDQNDPYGGSFTLVKDNRMDALKTIAQQEQLVLLVEGYIDANTPDQSGKPSYRVEHLSRLRRKAN